MLWLTSGTSSEVWATGLITAALALAVGGRPDRSPPPTDVEEEDIEYFPDSRTYIIHSPDDPEDPPDTYNSETPDYLHQKAWQLAMAGYLTVAELCSPPCSYRQVREVTGLHQRQQEVFRRLLLDNGLACLVNRQMSWTGSKGDRRRWLSSHPFPSEAPPKAPYPTLDPSQKGSEGV